MPRIRLQDTQFSFEIVSVATSTTLLYITNVINTFMDFIPSEACYILAFGCKMIQYIRNSYTTPSVVWYAYLFVLIYFKHNECATAKTSHSWNERIVNSFQHALFFSCVFGDNGTTITKLCLASNKKISALILIFSLNTLVVSLEIV